MRLFIAIEVPPPVGPTDAEPPHAAPEHLTLRFLGEVSPNRVPGLKRALEEVAHKSPAFDLILEGVGAFPSADRPRVVWIGATEGRTEAAELAERIATAIGPEDPRTSHESFVPHLTLFRVRSPGQRRRALALLSGSETPPPPRSVHVGEICLKESTLTPSGAVHRTVAKWSLTGA